jgi:hypothetical protein
VTVTVTMATMARSVAATVAMAVTASWSGARARNPDGAAKIEFPRSDGWIDESTHGRIRRRELKAASGSIEAEAGVGRRRLALGHNVDTMPAAMTLGLLLLRLGLLVVVVLGANLAHLASPKASKSGDLLALNATVSRTSVVGAHAKLSDTTADLKVRETSGESLLLGSEVFDLCLDGELFGHDTGHVWGLGGRVGKARGYLLLLIGQLLLLLREEVHLELGEQLGLHIVDEARLLKLLELLQLLLDRLARKSSNELLLLALVEAIVDRPHALRVVKVAVELGGRGG